jgi:PAS domain S-box-containing protein
VVGDPFLNPFLFILAVGGAPLPPLDARPHHRFPRHTGHKHVGDQGTADALRTSEQRLQTLLNALPFMIAYIDTKFCFRFNNRAYETWFGRRGDDMYGRHVKDVAGEAAFENIHDYMDRALSGATVVYETSLPYNDGNERDVLVTYIPDFENGGSVKGFHVLIEDVSARNAAERMKNEFVSSVSHGLRTPLTSIHGALRLIASGSLGEVPSQSRDMIELAERNSECLIYLVSDLLDIEKIGSGAMEFEFSAVDLTGLVRDAISLSQGLAESYSVDFRLSEPDSEIMVWVDRNRLGQVLGNLLSNAAKFSPRGGEVEMSVTHHDGQARVAASDHGPGISDDFKNRIFDRFTQSDSPDVHYVEGAGLGLSIAKAIVEKHNGHLSFDTTLGAGTSFYVDIPEWRENSPGGKPHNRA